MANSGRYTAAAFNRAAVVIGSTDPRYQAPEERSWKGYWSSLWCFGSQKSSKQVMPASHLDGVTDSSRGWAAGGPAQAGLSLAPPSSPASLVNSSLQSPASFTLPLSAASEGMFSPGPANMMFTIGPYAHETQLVSPPAFSTFTTEPSTAPLTPPPELAHLTTPSSPDVPFAQLLASSLEAKPISGGNRSFFSPFSLASPGEAGTGEFRASYIYQECPFADLISPASGFPASGASSPHPDTESIVPLDASVSTCSMSKPSDLICDHMSRETLNLPESPECESGKTLFPGGFHVASCRRDIDLDDVKLEGAPLRNCISQTTETFEIMDANPSINVTVSKNEEIQGILLTTELCNDESSFRSLQTTLQSCGADCEGAYLSKEIFSTSSTKQEVLTNQGMDSDVPPEESKNSLGLHHTAWEFQGFSGTLQSSVTIIDYTEECHETAFEENKNSGIEGQVCCQHPDVQVETNLKTCVQNVGTVDSRRFGERSVKCGELSPALELTGSPDSNFKHLPQWTHLGVTGSI